MLKSIAAGPGWLYVGAVILAMILRFLPHPWNFTPIGATFLFCGFRNPKPIGLALPLLAYAATDVVLDLYVYHTSLGAGALFVWLGFAAVWLIGRALNRASSFWSLGIASVAGSIAFFVVSNFGVWLSGHEYPRTSLGLASAYVAGVPFFQNTLVGDLAYNTLLFGAAALVGIAWTYRSTAVARHG
jgi:hypothetical protein